tara:strand:+ start:290 stop:493 length:204 start_codon:yes stop_codon:yes gene_type:complete
LEYRHALPLSFQCLILLGATFFHLDSGWEFPGSLTIIAIAVALIVSGKRLQVKFNPLDTYLPKQVRG